nr:hypothetical protein [uncultured Victivallis sp.]
MSSPQDEGAFSEIFRAIAESSYPSFFTALNTFSCVNASARAFRFNTRDTVATETFASRATSFNVTDCFALILLISV